MATLARRNGQVQILGAQYTATTHVSPRAGSFPSNAVAGQTCVIAGATGSPDIVYQYIRNSSGTYEWVEVTRAI